MPQNGSPVTWRELELALKPLQDGYSNLNGKVDQILETLAENRGENRAKRTVLDSGRFWLTTVVLLVTSSSASALFVIVIR